MNKARMSEGKGMEKRKPLSATQSLSVSAPCVTLAFTRPLMHGRVLGYAYIFLYMKMYADIVYTNFFAFMFWGRVKGALHPTL